MSELHFPWLLIAVLVPLLGALYVSRVTEPETAHRLATLHAAVTFVCAVGAWLNFLLLGAPEAPDHWNPFLHLGWQRDVFVMDNLNGPLVPMAALLYLATILATLRTKVQRFSFSWTLISESMVLAMLSCSESWAVITLLALSTIPPYLELKSRRRPTRIYTLHMTLFVILLVVGWGIIEYDGPDTGHSIWAVGMLTGAVLLRMGIVPVHCWMTDLFENATFGTALLFVTPMTGAYAAVHLVLPVAPEWALQTIAIVSLITSVYAAGMALVQIEARRFFCYLFLSHSSLVLVGLELATPVGLTGAYCLWLSVGLALAGFGLTLRSLEARTGRLTLTKFHGHYEHTPNLAVFFLLTGLASIGFPGTIGFVGTELLLEGAIRVFPQIGLAVVFATALNSIAVLQAYFRLFTGAKFSATVSLGARWSERLAVLSFTLLIIGGGLFPQPGIISRYRAAWESMRARHQMPATSTESSKSAH